MQLLKKALLFAVLLALFAESASAAGLDPSFGNGGKTTAAVHVGDGPFPRIQGMAISPDGRVYVLENSRLLAFEAGGTPAAGFGANGQVTVAPVEGNSEVKAMTVDSQGRVLVAGSVFLEDQMHNGHRVGYAPVYDAFLIRLLPNGERDMSFGDGGEVRTTFGVPRAATPRGPKYSKASAIATAIVVDSSDRPIVGGGYVKAYEGCESFFSPDPFVARLTVAGGPDTTFAGKGYALIGGHGEVSALARTPGDGAATLNNEISCGSRSEVEPSRFSALTATGGRAPSLDPQRRQFFMEPDMAIDPEGRVLVIETPPPVIEGRDALDRLLPSGNLDPSFGKKGRVVLKGVLRGVGDFTVDAQSRPILATDRSGLQLRRLDVDGALDGDFGPGGLLSARAAAPDAVALDGEGRIYTAGLVHNSRRTNYSVQVARFLPGL